MLLSRSCRGFGWGTRLRVVELFAGVGGFRVGLERAGHEVVWANEFDPVAAGTYDKNFGGRIDRRDITTISTRDIPPHNLIVGGFPCQAFSVAGKKAGFAEIRGTLFFEVMRIARSHQTKYLLLENVRGLTFHDGGRTFRTILTALDECGYDAQWQVLNSRSFGTPQNRERIFIVGHLRTEPRPQVFPIGARGREIAQPDEVQTAFRYPIKFARRNQTHIKGDYAYTIDTLGSGGVITEKGIRRLTPLECERLQGFDDNWTAGVSDSQRYKQMGNAVTTNVIEAIARRLPLTVT